MNTYQLEQFMDMDTCISAISGGVLPKDLLPQQVDKPKLFIVNCDNSFNEGSHWVVIFLLNNKMSEYFDPLGDIPNKDFSNYLTDQSDTVKVSVQKCQSKTSTNCGKFCLFYCYFRARNYSMCEIQNLFKTDLLYNDALVNEFYSLFTS